MQRAGMTILVLAMVAAVLPCAAAERIEISDDGLERAELQTGEAPSAWRRGADVPYPLTADWTSPLRVQVGGLAVVDVNDEGAEDVIVGGYSSGSVPPYDVWPYLI